MESSNFNLEYYLKVLADRKWFFIVPVVILLAVSSVISYTLSPVYRSSATILVETQNIPETFVQSTVTGYIEERLQMISQIVLNRENIMEIINEYDPYPKENMSKNELVKELREDIKMEMLTTEGNRRESGNAFAFTLSYEGKSPRKVYLITNRLATLYMEQNLLLREEKAESTYNYLENQMAGLEEEIAAHEGKIARFKDENLKTLPQFMEVNLGQIDRLEQEISAKRKQIQALVDSKYLLQERLAKIDPHLTVGEEDEDADQLKNLRKALLSQKAAKSPDHPDVVRLEKQIKALSEDQNASELVKEKTKNLEDKRAELSVLTERYSENHPDVKRLRKEISALVDEIEELNREKAALESAEEVEPKNPEYIGLSTQLEAIQMQINSERSVLSELQQKYQNIQSRIEQTPEVEQQYSMLQREYSILQAKYNSVQAKLQAAKEAKDLEENRMGEKLRLIDPPATPEEPIKPNRLAILVFGVMVSLGAGAGTCTLAELLNPKVRTIPELAGMTNAPVLAAIPRIRSAKEIRRRRRRFIIISVLAIIAVVALLTVVHYTIMPLDIFYISVKDRLTRMM